MEHKMVDRLDANHQHEVAVRELAWHLPAGMLTRILRTGITDILSAIASVEDGRPVTVEIVTPEHIVHELFDTIVRVRDEEGRPWVEAVVSLRAAQALAKLIGVTETDLEQAQGPIAVGARLSLSSQIEAAWAAMDLLGDGPRA